MSKRTKDKEVVRQYVVFKLSPQDVAKICQLSLRTVYSILADHKIPLRYQKKGRKSKPIKKYERWDKNELVFMYQELDMSASEMAWWFQISTRRMEKVLQDRGIKKTDD